MSVIAWHYCKPDTRGEVEYFWFYKPVIYCPGHNDTNHEYYPATLVAILSRVVALVGCYINPSSHCRFIYWLLIVMHISRQMMIGYSSSRARKHVQEQPSCTRKLRACSNPGGAPISLPHGSVARKQTNVVIRCKNCSFQARADMIVRGVWERCKVLNKLNKHCKHGETYYCTCTIFL